MTSLLIWTFFGFSRKEVDVRSGREFSRPPAYIVCTVMYGGMNMPDKVGSSEMDEIDGMRELLLERPRRTKLDVNYHYHVTDCESGTSSPSQVLQSMSSSHTLYTEPRGYNCSEPILNRYAITPLRHFVVQLRKSCDIKKSTSRPIQFIAYLPRYILYLEAIKPPFLQSTMLFDAT
jgi:hypothetical protein